MGRLQSCRDGEVWLALRTENAANRGEPGAFGPKQEYRVLADLPDQGAPAIRRPISGDKRQRGIADGTIAWVLITAAVAAAKIWWSGTAALVVFLVGVTIYIVVAVRYRRRHSQSPAT